MAFIYHAECYYNCIQTLSVSFIATSVRKWYLFLMLCMHERQSQCCISDTVKEDVTHMANMALTWMQ